MPISGKRNTDYKHHNKAEVIFMEDIEYKSKEEIKEFYEKGLLTPSLRKALEKNDFEI